MNCRADRRYWALVASMFCACAIFLVTSSCGGGSSSSASSASAPSDPPSTPTPLTAADVNTVVQNAVLSVNEPMVVAVADRSGQVRAVFETHDAPAQGVGNFNAMVPADELAAALARTAAFFSNDQAPLSSRTVRFISGIHFPPGVMGTPNADLYGIENTNRGCTLAPNFPLPPSTLIHNSNNPGLGIITGKYDTMDSRPFAVNPGGVPLFKNGHAVGGVGVVSTADETAEYAAFTAASKSGFLPALSQLPPPGVVIIGGIALPFVNQQTQPPGTSPRGNVSGGYIPNFSPQDNGLLPPDDAYLVGPNAGSKLSPSEVNEIIQTARATANTTRAVIRLPPDSKAKMTIAVSDLDGTLLGVFRMKDGTVFSVDVAATKARNVIWFSTTGSRDLPGVPSGTAVTNRTISFGAQPLFPPGIDGSGDGPFFKLYQNDTEFPCTQGSEPGAANTGNMSGIVFFPGSLPLYKNGTLVGGLGVSGDGVDQDDFVTAGAVNAACGAGGPCGVPDYQAPANIRADQVVIRNVRLPYLKFPRNPTQ